MGTRGSKGNNRTGAAALALGDLLLSYKPKKQNLTPKASQRSKRRAMREHRASHRLNMQCGQVMWLCVASWTGFFKSTVYYLRLKACGSARIGMPGPRPGGLGAQWAAGRNLLTGRGRRSGSRGTGELAPPPTPSEPLVPPRTSGAALRRSGQGQGHGAKGRGVGREEGAARPRPPRRGVEGKVGGPREKVGGEEGG